MKVKIKDSVRHHLSAENAIEELRKVCVQFYPDYTPTGVSVNRLRNPRTWQATAILEKEVDW